MVPKTIHCCWFGPREKSPLMRRCMESWRKHCPDFDVREWGEPDFDPATLPRYVREALDRGKWAFASDYARLRVLYDHGGVYFDTDVELLRPIGGLVEKHGAFAGFDFDGRNVNTGLGFCAEAGDPIVGEILDFYDRLSFELPDGSLFLLANTFICTPVFIRHGMRQDNSLQEVGAFTVFPKEYFCPKSFSYDRGQQVLNLSPETYSIHHYTLSWVGSEEERLYCESSEKEWVATVNKLKGVNMVSNY